MEKKNKWSVYDLQTSQYLHSGRNTKTLRRAVDEVWSLYVGTTPFEEDELKRISKWSTRKKKEWLENTQGYRFDKLKEVM